MVITIINFSTIIPETNNDKARCGQRLYILRFDQGTVCVILRVPIQNEL